VGKRIFSFRILFVLAALWILINGVTTYPRDKAFVKAPAVSNVSALEYKGSAPMAKEIVNLSVQHKAPEHQNTEVKQEQKKEFDEFVKAEEKKDSNKMHQILTTMAKSYKNNGEEEMAVQLNQKAVEVGTKIGKHEAVGENMNSIADIYDKAGKLDQAVVYRQKAINQFSTADANVMLERTLRSLTLTYQKAGKLEDAKKTLKEAEKVAAKVRKQTLEKGNQVVRKDKNSTQKKSATSSTSTKGSNKVVSNSSSAKSGEQHQAGAAVEDDGKHGTGSESN